MTAGARGTRVALRTAAGAKEEELEGLRRPDAIASFHPGATTVQLRAALERAMKGIYG